MRVVSFCHYLQGPACSQYLADLGADVIKIEPPTGAFERHWSGGRSHVDGVSAFLVCAYRNKRRRYGTSRISVPTPSPSSPTAAARPDPPTAMKTRG
jgi:hypothetical protein